MDVTYERRELRTRPGRRVPRAYRRLPRPLRFVGWAVFAVVAGAVIGGSFPAGARLLGAAAALAPGRLAWYGVRITGLLAWLALACTVLYGLLLTTRLLDGIAHRPVSARLHQDLALAALVLAALHGLLLLGDRTYAFTLAAVAIPFASPYAPAAVAAGQLAFCVVALIVASYFVRGRIGLRTWRLVHYLTFAAFAAVALHGLASGSDAKAPWATWSYLGPVAAAAFLATYRLVVGVAGRRMAPAGARAAVTASDVRGSRRFGNHFDRIHARKSGT